MNSIGLIFKTKTVAAAIDDAASKRPNDSPQKQTPLRCDNNSAGRMHRFFAFSPISTNRRMVQFAGIVIYSGQNQQSEEEPSGSAFFGLAPRTHG
jgi:hypothetical protein